MCFRGPQTLNFWSISNILVSFQSSDPKVYENFIEIVVYHGTSMNVCWSTGENCSYKFGVYRSLKLKMLKIWTWWHWKAFFFGFYWKKGHWSTVMGYWFMIFLFSSAEQREKSKCQACKYALEVLLRLILGQFQTSWYHFKPLILRSMKMLSK